MSKDIIESMIQKNLHDSMPVKIDKAQSILYKNGLTKKQFKQYFSYFEIGNKYRLVECEGETKIGISNSPELNSGDGVAKETSSKKTNESTTAEWRSYYLKKMLDFGLPPWQCKLITEQAPSEEELSGFVDKVTSKIIYGVINELNIANNEIPINTDYHKKKVAQSGFNNSIEILEFVNTIYQNGYSPNANNLPSDTKKKLRQLIDVGYMEIDKTSGDNKIPIPTRDLLRLRAKV